MTELIHLAGRRLIKGHVAHDTALILIDPTGEIQLTAAEIAAACAPTAGAAPCFLRLLHTAYLPGAEAFAKAVPQAQWFCESFSSDGEPCPLGPDALLLAAEALHSEGEIEVSDGDAVVLGTRAGARGVTHVGGLWTVDLGAASLVEPEGAQADAAEEAWDTAVSVTSIEGARAALSVEIAGPSAVFPLAHGDEWETLAGTSATGRTVAAEPALADGTRLVAVLPLQDEIAEAEDAAVEPVNETTDTPAEDRLGRAHVLVLGSSDYPETGTAAASCAVAVALHAWEGEEAPQDYLLDTPGGQLAVHVGSDPLAPGAAILLTAPAMLTGHLTLA